MNETLVRQETTGRCRHRIDVPCAALGLAPPPVRVVIRFPDDAPTGPAPKAPSADSERPAPGAVARAPRRADAGPGRDTRHGDPPQPGHGGPLMTATCPPGRAQAAARWVQGVADAEVEVEGGLAPTTVRFRFTVPPPGWAPLQDAAGLRRLDVHPEGICSLFLDAAPGQAQLLADELGWLEPPRVRQVADAPGSQLTHRQQRALSLAVSLGYYEIPRRIDLGGLASRIGVSSSALSELLRRAESALVMDYCDRSDERPAHGRES